MLEMICMNCKHKFKTQTYFSRVYNCPKCLSVVTCSLESYTEYQSEKEFFDGCKRIWKEMRKINNEVKSCQKY